jgi:Bacteriophytochrome (light-regulated signal transduction histidine kinase)
VRKTLERQNERLEEFTSVVSHDLRNPLNAAEIPLGVAQDECESAHLDAAADAVDRSQTLVEDLLTLARGEDTVTNTESVARTPIV